MCLELKELIDIYKESKLKDPNLFIYDEIENINYDFVNKEGLDINIKLSKINDSYKIFIFISRQGILLFNGMTKESNNNLINDYENLVSEINSLSVKDLINKYYVDLKENF